MALHIGFEPFGELLANPHLLIDGPARTPLLDLPCLALRPLLVQRGITLRLLADAADFIAVALPSVQDKGYAQYGYNYYRHDYSSQRAASYIHNIIAA